MINFCGVVPAAFKDIWTGRKEVEYRHRQKRNAILESIKPGETIVIFERGSARYVIGKVDALIIEVESDGVMYSIFFQVEKKLENCPYKHYQGFLRFENFASIGRA